jgi:hypothetical protein
MNPDILDSCSVAERTPVQDARSDLGAIYDNLFSGEQIDGVFRGCEAGVRLVALTNRRLMMVESTSCENRLALTSVPFARVTSVCFLAPIDGSVARSTAVGIKVLHTLYELGCQDVEQAQELHNLIIWHLICD